MKVLRYVKERAYINGLPTDELRTSYYRYDNSVNEPSDDCGSAIKDDAYITYVHADGTDRYVPMKANGFPEMIIKSELRTDSYGKISIPATFYKMIYTEGNVTADELSVSCGSTVDFPEYANKLIDLSAITTSSFVTNELVTEKLILPNIDGLTTLSTIKGIKTPELDMTSWDLSQVYDAYGFLDDSQIDIVKFGKINTNISIILDEKGINYTYEEMVSHPEIIWFANYLTTKMQYSNQEYDYLDNMTKIPWLWCDIKGFYECDSYDLSYKFDVNTTKKMYLRQTGYDDILLINDNQWHTLEGLTRTGVMLIGATSTSSVSAMFNLKVKFTPRV